MLKMMVKKYFVMEAADSNSVLGSFQKGGHVATFLNKKTTFKLQCVGLWANISITVHPIYF